MPVNTLRAWLLGIIWAMIIPGVNEFYYFRYPSIMVGGVGVSLRYMSAVEWDCEPISADRRTACELPNRSHVGKMGPECQDPRRVSQSRYFHNQGTCKGALSPTTNDLTEPRRFSLLSWPVLVHKQPTQ